MFLAVFALDPFRIAGTVHKQTPVDGEKGWALGCGAMLMERNFSRHDILAAEEITPRAVRRYKKLLSSWWDTHNRAELLETLVWLDEEGGHRKLLDTIGREVSEMSEEQFKSTLAMYGSDVENRQKLIIARRYYKYLGDKGILGWDYTRYIAVCRWGYTAGYITEQEAWDKIMPVAGKLQKTFDSWEDLGENYLIGRQFWSYRQTQISGDLFQRAFQRLMSEEDSPWNKYPWDMNLGQ